MEKKRSMEILNNLVEFVAIGNDVNGQIEELLKYGFEGTELVRDFNFSKADVEAITGDEIPEPAKEGFMTPPVYSESEIRSDIDEFINAMKKKYSSFQDLSALSTIMFEFINGSNVAYKLWSDEDFVSRIDETIVSDSDINKITNEAINILNRERGIDILEDITDQECNVVQAAVNEATDIINPAIVVNNIVWDIDRDDFDSDAEYESVNENVLPSSVSISWLDLKNHEGIANYLSDTYGYCVDAYTTEVKAEN